jgi:hypothetical protein
MSKRSTVIICLLMFLHNNKYVIAQDRCDVTKIQSTTPIVRFINNNNGTVTDKNTGLVWKKCSEGQIWNKKNDNCEGTANKYIWQTALNSVYKLNSNGGFAGKTDWHVPNIKEIASILEAQCYEPAINLTIFPDTPSYDFWSSSSVAISGQYAWAVLFSSGEDNGIFKKNKLHVRLVRN